jgi:hypothetical protein
MLDLLAFGLFVFAVIVLHLGNGLLWQGRFNRRLLDPTHRRHEGLGLPEHPVYRDGKLHTK